MADAVIVPGSVAIPIPEGVDPAVAALIGCCVSTGVGAVLNTAAVPKGASVAVIGLGGVGMSCVLGAVLAGADCIVAVDRVADKLDLAVDFGATAAVDASADRLAVIAAVHYASGGGLDYVFEASGAPPAAALAMDLLSSGSTAVMVGILPEGTTLSVDAARVTQEALRIVGSKYGSVVPSDDFPRYAELYLAGRLPIDRLISRRWPLDEVDAAFEAVRDPTGLRSVIDLSQGAV
jgi:S-(hydroxymethyl)glutathione dehydrogenase/alcohol dehydrogenase